MPYDYTDAPPSRDFELIPHGTVATLVLHIRPGGAGEDDMCKRSKDGSCEMLDAELTVLDGPHKGRKFWENWILSGTTDGHAQAANISRGTLKAILDSALGLKPLDTSPEARAARTVSLKQFEGMTFMGKIGIEKGGLKKEGDKWPDKNFLAAVVTPDRSEWHPVPQPPPFNGGSGAGQAAAAPAAAPPVTRPSWAS
jgi:hypothetical protein